jgi:hypothetical protein
MVTYQVKESHTPSHPEIQYLGEIMSEQREDLYKYFSKHLPGPVAWVLSLLCWPLAELMKALPELVSTVLLHRREDRKIRLDEEKWMIEKQKLLAGTQRLATSEVNNDSED